MKAFLIALLLVGSVARASFESWAVDQTHDKKAGVWAAKVHGMAAKWCGRLKFPHEQEVLATLWVESWLDPDAVGLGGELGMGQATQGSIQKYGAELAKLGWPGRISDPDWQVGLCVCELRDKAAAYGLEDSLRFYNGSDWRSRRHLDHVRKALKGAFGSKPTKRRRKT